MSTAPDCFQLVVGVLGVFSFWYTWVFIWFFEFVSVCLFSLVSTNIGGGETLFNQNVVKWEFLVVKWYKVGAELDRSGVNWKKNVSSLEKRLKKGHLQAGTPLYSHSVCVLRKVG